MRVRVCVYVCVVCASFVLSASTVTFWDRLAHILMYIPLPRSPLSPIPSHSPTLAFAFAVGFLFWFFEFTFRLLLFILRTFSELETNFISSHVYLFFLFFSFFLNTFLLSLALNAIALSCCSCCCCCGLCFMGQYMDIFGLSVPVSVVFDKRNCVVCAYRLNLVQLVKSALRLQQKWAQKSEISAEEICIQYIFKGTSTIYVSL